MRAAANYYDLLHGLSDETLARITAGLEADYARANGSRAIAQEGIDLIDAGRKLHGGETRQELAADWFASDGMMLEISHVKRTIDLIKRERAVGAGRVRREPVSYTPKQFWTSLSPATLARIMLALIDEGKPRRDRLSWYTTRDLVARAFAHHGLFNPNYSFTVYDSPILIKMAGFESLPKGVIYD